MRPRLLVIAGPSKDLTIPLPDGEATIGRDPANVVAIVDPSVSRKHCLLRQEEDGRFSIKDLESRNGTLVNGNPMKEQYLHHGDEIATGDSLFLFLVDDEDRAASASQVEFDDGQPMAETRLIHPKEAVYLQPDRLLKELPATSQVGRNLNALLKISRVVHAIRDLEELQAQLLDLIFEVVPAGRGAILLSEGEDQEFNSLYARTRQGGQPQLVRVSRTIARKVMKENVAILGVDIASSGNLREVESLVASHVRSLVCVPLSVFQRMIGCIYLDSTNAASRFNEEHLQLMAGVAGVSAVALDNARRLQWLEQENQRLLTEIRQDQSLVGEGARMKEIFLFLDEIGELAPALQVKLLRVLQEREFERVGGTHPIKVNIRLIAATNRDLEDAVRKVEFRQDLYYRLAVVKMTMPPLRERREDIPMLTRHFLQKYAMRCRVKAKPISREAMAALVHYEWPGNVRELENAIERSLVMGSSDMVLLEDLPESLLEQNAPEDITEGKYHGSVKELKKQLILDAVEQTGGNYVEAAGILGVHPNYLHRLIRNLGLKDELNQALRGRGRVSGGAA